MKRLMHRLWTEESGVLSFEWVLLVTLLTIGIVSGLTAARDAIIDELGDVAEAMLAVDQSYTISNPLLAVVHDFTEFSGGTNSAFIDAFLFQDCTRVIIPNQQQPKPVDDNVGGG